MANQDKNDKHMNADSKSINEKVMEEALLFDESTVLSRNLDSGEEKDKGIDTSNIMGSTRDSGNENIQTFVDPEFNFHQSDYLAGVAKEEELAEGAAIEESEGVKLAEQGVAPSKAAQFNIREGEQATARQEIPPQEAEPASLAGESDAFVEDFVDQLDSADGITNIDMPEPEEATTEPEPEPKKESKPEPEPEPYEGKITVTTPDKIIEGEDITIKVTVDNPPVGSDLEITLNDGTKVTIKEGETEAIVTVPSRPDDVYKQGDEEKRFEVKETTGGGYDDLDTSDSSTTTVIDNNDLTTVKVTAIDTDEGSETVTFEFELSNKPDTGETVTLKVDVGGTEYEVTLDSDGKGSLSVENPNTEDVYLDASDLTATVTEIIGGNFEATSVEGASATAKIDDTIDDTTLTLSAEPVIEGDQITIKAEVDNVPETDLTITLDNGETITIKAGETTGEVTFDNPIEDNIYAEEDRTITVKVESTEGGNYENLLDDVAVDVTVTDEPGTPGQPVDPENPVENQGDEVEVTLSAEDALEGKDITIVAKVEGNNPPKTDLVITLDNGETITIKAGELEGSVTFENPNTEDVYLDGSTETFEVAGTEGGGYENLVVQDSVDVKVDDTIDDTTLTLSAEPVIEGDQITIKAEVDNAPETDLTITLDNGETITIKAGETTGEVTFDNPIEDNIYAEEDRTVTVKVESTEGGNYESLLDDVAVDVTVTDEPGTPGQPVDPENPVENQGDEVEVTLSAEDALEGKDITIVAKVEGNNPPKTDLVITLDNGETITIKAGELEGSVTFENPNTEDVYLDGSTETFEVAGTEGGGYENLVVQDSVDVKVDDTIDDTTLTLSAEPVIEGDQITIKAEVDNAPETDLTITLDNGETITIKAGETTGEVTFDNPIEDNIYAEEDRTVTVKVESTEGGNYENLLDDVAVDVTVTDEPGTPGQPVDPENPVENQGDEVEVTLSAEDALEGKDITIVAKVEGNNPPKTDLVITLDNGETITIKAGELEGSVTFENPNTEDVYLDGSTETFEVAGTEGGGYENLVVQDSVKADVADTTDTTTVKIALTDTDATYAEGDAVKYTITLENEKFSTTEHGGLEVVVNINGEQVTVEIPAGADTVTFEHTPQDPDLIYVKDFDITAKVEEVIEKAEAGSGKQFEEIIPSEDSVTIRVEDKPSNPDTDGPNRPDPETPVDPEEPEVPVDPEQPVDPEEPEVPVDPEQPVDPEEPEVPVDPEQPVDPEEPEVPVEPDNPITQGTEVTLTLSDIEGLENQQVQITATLSEKAGTDFTVTLDNGATIFFAEGTTEGISTAFDLQEDDVFVDAESYEVKVTDTGNHNFENLVVSKDATVTVDDTIDTTKATLSGELINGEFVYTIELSNEDGLDVTQHQGINFTLTNESGDVIGVVEIEAGNATGSFTADKLTATGEVTITGTEVLGGVEFENLVTEGTAEIEQPQFTITGSTVKEEVDGESTSKQVTGEVTVELDKAYNKDITLTLKNETTGKEFEVIVEAGETSVTVVVETGRVDDYYQQGTTSETITVVDISDENIKVEDINTDNAVITIEDDVDPVSVTITPAQIVDKQINAENILSGDKGFTVIAKDPYGNDAEISINGSPAGFGVLSDEEKNSEFVDQSNKVYSGHTSEIGMTQDGRSESIEVQFENSISSLDVAFAWRATQESAKVEFFSGSDKAGHAIIFGGDGSEGSTTIQYYDKNGNKIGEPQKVQGGTDKVDLVYTFKPAGNIPFDKAIFTAVDNGKDFGQQSDYLIHSISYKEVVSGGGDTIITGSNTVLFEVEVSEKPDPDAFDFINTHPTADVVIEDENGNVIYEGTVNLDADGKATVSVETSGQKELIAKVDNVQGNYEKVNSSEVRVEVEDPTKPEASDDEITTQEDADYLLKADDFGDNNENVAQIKLNDLPENGDLYIIKTEYTGSMNDKAEYTDSENKVYVKLGSGDVIDISAIENGSVIFKPDADYHNEGRDNDNFTFSISNGDDNFVGNYTTSITVEAVKDVEDDYGSTKVNTAVEVDVLANDDWSGENPTITHIDGQEISVGESVKVGNGTEIDGGAGSDYIIGTGGDDVINGGAGDDILQGGGGDDFIYGGKGDDTIYGGEGDDVLIGGKGDDTLTGGAGKDTFVWLKGDAGTIAKPAVDTVTDFDLDEDQIDISKLLEGYNGTDLSSYLVIKEENGNAQLEINSKGELDNGPDQIIILENVTKAQIQEALKVDDYGESSSSDNLNLDGVDDLFYITEPAPLLKDIGEEMAQINATDFFDGGAGDGNNFDDGTGGGIDDGDSTPLGW